MRPELRVLIVKDQGDNEEQIEQELGRNNRYKINPHYPIDAADLKSVLVSDTWDLAIVKSRSFTPVQVLEITNRHQPNLPVMAIVEPQEEDLAIAAMKAGVRDYLLVDNLTRLVPAIERELKHVAEQEQRSRTEAALQESEVLYRSVVATMSEGIVIQDSEGKIIACNTSAERILGLSHDCILGRTSLDPNWHTIHEDGSLFPGETHPAMVTLRTGQPCYNVVMGVHLPDGSITWISINSQPLFAPHETTPYGSVTSFADITGRKQAEAQLLRSQRLESLGTLASGIAHDFNNILTPILATSQLLSLRLSLHLEERDLALLKLVEDSSKRGAELVKQILAFARGIEGKRVSMRVEQLIEDTIPAIRATFPKNITIDIERMDEPLRGVCADCTQLHQVLMNLCLNARDAMPHGGRLRVVLANVALDGVAARANVDARAGNYVQITVSDTGTGMPPEMLDRIFDPFFTTKEQGKGTGLGLSTALGIIKNHDGFIQVTSELSKGTEFKIYLPCIATPSNRQTAKKPENKGQGELILIVDDEPLIRYIIQTTLENYNYQTLVAENGSEAISIYSQNRDRIALAIVDMMMPAMDGLTVMRTLKKIEPNIQAIAISGSVIEDRVERILETGFKAFLAKPFTNQDLLTTLTSLLGRSSQLNEIMH
jgi:two-component system, cell cycle sensor histidine kinase and response regulator CckA